MLFNKVIIFIFFYVRIKFIYGQLKMSVGFNWYVVKLLVLYSQNGDMWSVDM